jgi:putative peptidoglycan lipid II flippase
MLKRFRTLWQGETNGLTTAAIIIGLASLTSRLVGVLRDRILASTFGAGIDLDAYYAAFRIPDTIYNLIILGALSAGFIPIFTEYLEKKSKAELWLLAEQVFSVVAVTMAIVCTLLAVFAPFIIPFTVPGFTLEQVAVTVHLSRILFLSPLLLGLSAILGGILQATRRIFAFAMAPVFYNVGIILGAVVLVPRMGIEGVAWGVILGSVLHFSIQFVVVLKLGLRRVHIPSFTHPGVKRIFSLMAPRTAGLAVSQLNVLILLGIASQLPAGSVAIMNLAINLQSFPVGIFGISYAVAAFPLLARAASGNNQDEFFNTLNSSARKITFLLLPITAIFFLLRAQIVRLVFGAGVFNWDDTIRTATVLGIFTFSLVGQALVPLYARAFYALQNTRTPFWVSLISEAMNVGIALLSYQKFGLIGLAVAFSLSTYVNIALLCWRMHRTQHTAPTRSYWHSFVVNGLSCVAMFVVGYPMRQLVGTLFPLHTFWQVALQTGSTLIVATAAFVLVARLNKSPELSELFAAMNRKIFSSNSSIAGAEEVQGV